MPARIAALLALVATAACGSARTSPEPLPVEAGLPAAPGEYGGAVDVLHYDVELSLGAPEIQGRATLTVRPNGAAELPLDFTGMGIGAVLADGRPAGYDYARGKLTVTLPRGQGDADTDVVVEYFGTPDDGFVIRDNVHGDPVAFADNWPNRARFWLPSVDHPTDKATVSLTVHAPPEWQVIGNGALVGRPAPAAADALGGGEGRNTWRWASEVPQPTYTMVVGAADFAVESLGRAACGNAPVSPDPDGCIDVSFWAYPEDVAFARQVFDRAPEMVDFFTRTIGPYPFAKLANVQSATRFGGMENASAIFYSERAIAASRLGEGTVAHEVSHQWFGDSVTGADWTQLWLSEGFATYFGALFFEAADGLDDFRERMERSRQSYLRSGVTARPIVPADPPENLFDLLNVNNYSKGAWVLHMLRGVVGDETFFEGMRAYYERHAYGTVLTNDLRQAFEDVSGRPLDWFFDQWVFQPGYPVLESEWEMSGDGSEVVLTVRQTQSADWPTFRLPLQVRVVPGGAAGDAQDETIELTEREQMFRISVPREPANVRIDPDGWVLKG
ncbi:MAG: M1 family metallopeptidase [Gemmatimonadetes bacterium]|nr:M1 family metallopeptidase [Gemmatimonadota bacterium]MXX73595.1 M1 family metallopeptidase [Gemmatimonadota bacterium]MYC91950.1 M1 family metallopeptidase [Gemmatimonadota bacterium]MYG37073.1 M1 family metallopeptidase [Gemmatimonadota bacterium]MYJ18799.1 M1 family metallopeptidase [Gemmatimonadota bacterium]